MGEGFLKEAVPGGGLEDEEDTSAGWKRKGDGKPVQVEGSYEDIAVRLQRKAGLL